MLKNDCLMRKCFIAAFIVVQCFFVLSLKLKNNSFIKGLEYNKHMVKVKYIENCNMNNKEIHKYRRS